MPEVPDDDTGALARAVDEMQGLGALRFDAGGRVLSCNATMGLWLGTSAAELRGAPLEAVLIPPDAAALNALLRDGRPHVARRVRLAFRAVDESAMMLECAIALDAGGGALLGRPLLPGGREGR
jgi:PAS domain-containing protein